LSGTTGLDGRVVAEEYRAHLLRLRASALRVLRDPAAADDVAAEALARAWLRRESFESDDAFAAWTWRVARNLCVDHLRGRRRTISLDEVADRADERADVSASIELEEERRFVRTAFSRLDDRHRTVLYLRDVEGVGYDEIARRMGTTTDNARQVTTRARAGLRHALRLVADGLVGILLWLRLRARGAGERLAAATQPSLVRFVEAAAMLAIAGGLLLVPGSNPIEPDPPRERPGDARATHRDVGRRVEPVPVSDAGGGRVGAGGGLVDAGVDRERGSAEVHARVPTPAGDEDVWVRAWREGGEAPSVVLGIVDAVSAAVCAPVVSLCGLSDGVAGSTGALP
jgi:RNA polymerase sigma-70 factor (ECF subfamily)